MIEACYSPLLEILDNKHLSIPDYQRPYKWSTESVSALLNDLSFAYKDGIHNEGNLYRLGNIIIHKHEGSDNNEKLDIVDGQQRLLTLSLFFHAIDESYSNALLERVYGDSVSINNIKNNYAHMLKWIKAIKEENVNPSSFSFLEVVVITVTEVEEAFTLFDSQNTRGLKLDPHDLLKAYHLREMTENETKKREVVKEFEKLNPQDVRELYADYLYPISRYLKGLPSINFTIQRIDAFKGVTPSTEYNYASSAEKTNGIFQIDQEFLSGIHFFKMTKHYLDLLKKVREYANSIPEISEILNMNTTRSRGLGYAKELFYQTLLYFYDRFAINGEFDEMAATKKLFVYCMMLFIDMRSLGEASISNYALGKDNWRYSNHLSIFTLIHNAKTPQEISFLEINTKTNNTDHHDAELLEKLKAILEK